MRMRRVIKPQNFTRFQEYFMDRDPFLQPHCGPAGTFQTPPKMWLNLQALSVTNSFILYQLQTLGKKFRKHWWMLYSLWAQLWCPTLAQLSSRKSWWCSEVTAPWFLYAPLVFMFFCCSRASPSINTPLPPFSQHWWCENEIFLCFTHRWRKYSGERVHWLRDLAWRSIQ